ncbi:hypothetical protein EPUS_07254 [Endocarpon pusillum Z07020]|uniref:DUF7729 domain-containing protein n=1 Tax=Endocarpon pusillum (strain Z07020 / HMAS-L-300199) TaxID=1263415 RepID=U1FVC4_ENDPU|nr:uncharacterized protein EPUS_07254 [Endocarpon pusillum Z07020]ERF68767.1 hypothetical protein EPUS_07254 [Endocarpon pusillum Z07020]
MSSLPDRPRPGRRRVSYNRRAGVASPGGYRLLAIPTTFLSILILITTVLPPSVARDIQVPYQEYDSLQLRRLARRGEIAIDRGAPPPRPTLRQRQENADPFGSTVAPLATPTSEQEGSTAASSTTTPASESEVSAMASATDIDSAISIQSTLVVTPTNTMSANATSTGNATSSIETASATAGPPSALPSPFDTSLGDNFTAQGCPNFFNAFLNNATFRDCHPTSLLLQNSHSFFRISRSLVSLSQALDASCKPSLAQCSPLMASLASQLMQDSNCGQDYRNQNSLVVQAHAGLVSYEPLYRATCLRDRATGNYCFADAITNTSNLSDSYPYYTALGTILPAAARPTCDECLQGTMEIFAGYATNRDQPVSKTYISTAQQINMGCGPEFVNTTVPVGTVSNSAVKQGTVTEASALLAFVLGLIVACVAF